jgi:hypothetical protein
MTKFILRRAVSVSPDPAYRESERGALLVLAAGTNIDDIPDSELAQLSPEHFTAVGPGEGSGELPEDWRTNKATLDHDRRQARVTETELAERAKARDGRTA